MSEQRQQVETSLVQIFWAEVQTLTELQAWYSYQMSIFNAQKKGVGETQGLLDPDQENGSLKNILQQLHLSIRKSYIHYKTLASATKKEIKLEKDEAEKYKTFEALKNSFNDDYIIPNDALEVYVIVLNRYVGLNVVQDPFKTQTEKVMDTYAQALKPKGESHGSIKSQQ